MYTLQILDAGQTFLHSLEERAVSLGASDSANIRLTEEGIAPIHARLIPELDHFRLVAEPDCNVLVNGQVATDVILQLGDRVEIGRSVMIIGKTVVRAARPEDVLSSAVPRSVSRRRPSPSKSMMVPVIAIVCLIVVAFVLSFQSGSSGDVRGLLGDVEAARRVGDFDRAKKEIAELRTAWAGAEDGRLSQLDAAEDAVQKTEVAHAMLVAEITDVGGTRGYVEWFDHLNSLLNGGGPDQQVAARKVSSRLRSLIRQRDEDARQQAISNNKNYGGRSSGRKEKGGVSQQDDAASNSATVDSIGGGSADAPKLDPAEVGRLCSENKFVQALSLVQAGYSQATSPEAVNALREVEATVTARAKLALAELLREVQVAEQQGRLQRAVALLQVGRHQFPAAPWLPDFAQELSRLEAIAEAAEAVAKDTKSQGSAADQSVGSAGSFGEADRLQTLESIRSHMASVRAAEEGGDFEKQAALLREAADSVRSRDAGFADRLAAQAGQAAVLASWSAAVRALVQDNGPFSVVGRDGQAVELHRVEGHNIIARSANGEMRLEWDVLNAESIILLATKAKANSSIWMSAAAMLYRLGDQEAAEKVLARILREKRVAQADLDPLIARGRGEDPSTDSYKLVKREFVSVRQIELEQLSKGIRKELKRVLRKKDLGARGDYLTSTVAQGPLHAEALAISIREELTDLCERLNDGPLRKQVQNLTEERGRLDAARKHAKELIYDTVRYFYPYKPPAVSGQKHAEYGRVQADVNERVAALRGIWTGSKIKMRVPQKLRQDLGNLDWLAAQANRLGGFPDGESAASILAAIDWARALDPGKTVTLQGFCLSSREYKELQNWRRVNAYNKAVAGEFSVAVNSLLQITNDYRAMFRHRPIAIVKSAGIAAQGHASEMSKLGYFAHMSPTDGRRSPIDRLRLAGYMFGVSENIAMTSGALSAHNAWCRSSGHHRNLLMPSHTEIGIGNEGRYWVQNFGSGQVHEADPAWARSQAK